MEAAAIIPAFTARVESSTAFAFGGVPRDAIPLPPGGDSVGGLGGDSEGGLEGIPGGGDPDPRTEGGPGGIPPGGP